MIVEILIVGPIAANCFIIGDEETMEGAIIDPGEDAIEILEKVKETGLNIKYIIATHGHFDHCAAVKQLKDHLDCEFLLHEEDLFYVRDSVDSARKWGFTIDQVPDPDSFLKDNEVIKLGSLELRIIHTPGHSPGGISIYIESEKALFSGDTIFQGSIGRTDFRKGSLPILTESIKDRIYSLPDNTQLYTGHGPVTTVGDEKKYNPFVRG